jgi:hypothetical protein
MTVDEFPIEIRHLMMYRQKERHGKKDWSVFQKNRTAGFTWSETPEKGDFWNVIINREEFDVFYAKYPKVQYPKDMPEEIIILALDRRVEQGWISISSASSGFIWSETLEMYTFWNDIHKGRYNVYYEKYGGIKSYMPCTLSTVSFAYEGDIADFPPEIVEMMLQRQFEQTGKRDVSVFENKMDADKEGNGFTWGVSPEKHDFWHVVIDQKKFDVFFEKYPKESLIFSHIKTKQNEKEHRSIEVQRPVATISTRERCTASGVSGRRSSTAIAIGHLSHKAIAGC